MKPTDKQITANRQNSAKSTGPATTTGKEIASRNSFKHGLLAKEIVINTGEGIESQEQFDALLNDLNDHFDPQDVMEEMLVEKIAVAYWRLKRVYRFETGLVRQQLDTATDNFYNEKNDFNNTKINKTNEEIDKQMEQEKESVLYWENDKKDLSKMYKEGKSLNEILDWENNWEWLVDKYQYLFPDDNDLSATNQIVEFFKKDQNWSDNQIWQAHIELCDDRIKHHNQQILSLEKEKEANRLKLQVKMKLGSVPVGRQLEQLLKYEGSIEKQFYKAVNELERLQRLRKGDIVPPPVNIDLNITSPDGS